jgi:transcriptional regulator with XRE-family HTH domain
MLRQPLAGQKAARHSGAMAVAPTLGSRLRLLREGLGLTQDEVSARSVDEDGQVLHRIEVGHVESGRNLASTKRVRSGLARAFGVPEDDLFEYLDGALGLPALLRQREETEPRPDEQKDGGKSAYDRAVAVVVSDGYGTLAEVRRAGALAREELPPEKQARLGVLDWANHIELTLRLMRRAGDAAASSGVNRRAGASQGAKGKGRGRRSA